MKEEEIKRESTPADPTQEGFFATANVSVEPTQYLISEYYKRQNKEPAVIDKIREQMKVEKEARERENKRKRKLEMTIENSLQAQLRLSQQMTNRNNALDVEGNLIDLKFEGEKDLEVNKAKLRVKDQRLPKIKKRTRNKRMSTAKKTRDVIPKKTQKGGKKARNEGTLKPMGNNFQFCLKKNDESRSWSHYFSEWKGKIRRIVLLQGVWKGFSARLRSVGD